MLLGVEQHHSLDVLFSAGFGESEAASKYLTKWVCFGSQVRKNLPILMLRHARTEFFIACGLPAINCEPKRWVNAPGTVPTDHAIRIRETPS
jgi:hypothetical protein